ERKPAGTVTGEPTPPAELPTPEPTNAGPAPKSLNATLSVPVNGSGAATAEPAVSTRAEASESTNDRYACMSGPLSRAGRSPRARPASFGRRSGLRPMAQKNGQKE